MDSVKVVPSDDPTPIPISEEAVNCMETIKSAAVVSEGDIKVPIRKAVLEQVLQFLKLNHYKEIKTPMVDTNDMQALLKGEENEKNYEFLSKFKFTEGRMYSSELAELFKAASYLQCRSLMQLIGFSIATIIFFNDSSESYNLTRNRLQIDGEITVEDEQRYTKIFR